MSRDKNIIIIGCGAGGGTAAQFARKTNRNAFITIFEKSGYPQYSKCGLPYAISGEIPQFDDLIEYSEDWFKKNNIDLFLETTVREIGLDGKVAVAKKGNDTIEKPFDALVIATGAQPWIPPIQDIHNDGVFVVRTLNGAKQISSFVQNGKRATIVGAGLIGLEMADSLCKKGMDVTIVEALPNILANTLDNDMSGLILQVVNEKCTVFLDYLITKVEHKHGTIKDVIIKNNKNNDEKRIETDLLIIATGCKPDILLAKKIGCAIGKTGGIKVNGKTETSVENIYAVGDCTEYYDFITKAPALVGLGSIVVRQGIAAGTNATGGNYQLPKGILQTCTSKFFGLEIAAVGPISQQLQGIPAISGKFKGLSLPEYFPGGKTITIKVIANKKTGKMLAAQAVGSNAAQRINTFACAIQNEMNIEEFKKLETAYAPPIAPTLDAITLACDAVSLKMNRRQR